MLEKHSFVADTFRVRRVTLLAGILSVAAAGSSLSLAPLADESRPAVSAGPERHIDVLVVDEAGKPVAGAKLRRLDEPDDRGTATTDANGLARVILPPERRRDPYIYSIPTSILAIDAAGNRQGLATLPLNETTRSEPLRLLLKAPRELTVRVVDKDGKPIEGAVAVVRHSDGLDLERQRTNDGGVARFRFPDVGLESVVAFKPGAGVDRWRGTSAAPPWDWYEVPAEVTLTLEGATTVRLRALDSAQKPVPQAIVAPQYIDRSQPRPTIVAAGLADAVTDENGVAQFDWYPADVRGATFSVRSKNHFFRNPHGLQVAFGYSSGDHDLKAELLRLTEISGRVVDRDSKPAAGALVSAFGIEVMNMGRAMNTCREETRTAADGTYSMKLIPDQTFTIGVARDDDIAETRAGIALKEDRPIRGVDFTLGDGAWLEGKVLIGAERKPAASRELHVAQIVGEAFARQDGPGSARWFVRPPADFRPPNRAYPLFHTRTTITDADGRYRIRLGPGEYQLHTGSVSMLSANPSQAVKIEGAAKQEYDVLLPEPAARPQTAARRTIPAPPPQDLSAPAGGAPQPARKTSRMIAGKAVLATHASRAIAAAQIVAGNPPERETTNGAGEFQMALSNSEWLISGRSADGLLVGIVDAPVDKTTVILPLQPMAVTRGRLMGPDGTPLSGREVVYFVNRAHSEGNRSYAASGSVWTDALGRFVLTGLVRDWKFQLIVPLSGFGGPPPGGPRPAPTRTVGEHQPQQLQSEIGDIRLASMPPQPLQGDELIDETLRVRNFPTPPARLATSLLEGRLTARRVLLVTGPAKAPELRRFLAMQTGQVKIAEPERQVLAEHVVLALDVSDGPPLLASRMMLHDLAIAEADAQKTLFALLDEEGRVAAQTTAESLISEGLLDIAKLVAFLRTHAPKVPDAAQLLSEALAQAKREDKRVLVHDAAPLQTTTILLSNALERQRELLGKDYVVVTLDERWRNGPQTLERLRRGTAIAPVTILDVDGKTLASHSGYPLKKDDVEAWAKLLEATAKRLGDGERKTVVAGLAGG